MRIIEPEQITDAVAKLCIGANVEISADIRRALENARDAEESKLARSVLETLLKNADVAKRENLPICQDTGMAVVFVTIGRDSHINGDIEAAINEGVRRGYKDGYFRNSVVHDPISRKNTGDNTPAVIHYEFAAGSQLEITVAPKGFGSENMSAVRMLNPSDGLAGVMDFVTETVRLAEANPCPPIVVGVGVGGTMEKAALLAKKALLRDVDSANEEKEWAEVESRLLERINSLGIGAAGYGGKTTALGVNVLTYPTHIAGLPVAVNIGCHVTRHKAVVL
ncbi:MAG: fumarate hydratase [Defluviitaleaceae bacterium]|nr:fumarate hydratase [Defluviitaleaceae bacterium]MCL2262381.1 fumarate hydratase [Defluviitaleaceae bacterium]